MYTDKKEQGCRIVAIITNAQMQFERRSVHDDLAKQIKNLPFTINPNIDVAQQVFEILYSTPDFPKAIMTILAVLGRTFQVDRVYVFEDSDDHLRCSNTFEWCAPLITPEKDNLQDLSYETDLNSEYHENFSNLGVFLCPDIEKLPKVQRDILLPQGIKSMLQCSIIDNGLFSGYIGFDICKKKREWSQNQVDTLMQTTKILGTFIIKKRHEEKLIQANRKMTDILDRIPAGIGIFEQKSSGSFQIHYQNDSCYTLMGTSRNRITDNNEFIQRAIEKSIRRTDSC